MSRHAFVIGAGQIGAAIADRLAERGWRVTVATRGQRGLPPALTGRVDAVTVDRDTRGALACAISGGTDAVIDTIAYDDTHADQLLALRGDVGSFVVVSSASVYADAQGRSLDRSQGKGFPAMPEPITEAQPTVEPGPQTYSTRKRALERRMLDSGACATVLRLSRPRGPRPARVVVRQAPARRPGDHPAGLCG